MSIWLWLFLFITVCFLYFMGLREIKRLEEKFSINPISTEERLKQDVEWMRRQSEIENLRIQNTALAVWHEMKMQDSQCSMSNADINRNFENCQFCNYCYDKLNSKNDSEVIKFLDSHISDNELRNNSKLITDKEWEEINNLSDKLRKYLNPQE